MSRQAENELYDLLSQHGETWHTAISGQPPETDPAIIYRMSGSEGIYESDEPIGATETAQIYVYQQTRDPLLVDAIRETLRVAQWRVRGAAQVLDSGYYRDELTATKTFYGGIDNG